MTTPTRPAPLESTLALVARAREGDQAAIELIAERYQAALARFGHGRLPRAARGLVDTEDIVQMAVVRTLGRLKSLEPTFSGSLLAYLRRAVLNQIRDEIRRAQRRPQSIGLPDDLPAADQDPLEAAISKEALERYDAALAQLPADQQEAFLMRVEMNCSYREIADALGRSGSEAARMLVRRAIRTMARLLKRSTVA